MNGLHQDCSAYLIPELIDESHQQVILREHFQDIFELELESWARDPSDWPQHRDLKLFAEWFTIEFHSLVMDVSDDLIQTWDDD